MTEHRGPSRDEGAGGDVVVVGGDVGDGAAVDGRAQTGLGDVVDRPVVVVSEATEVVAVCDVFTHDDETAPFDPCALPDPSNTPALLWTRVCSRCSCDLRRARQGRREPT